MKIHGFICAGLVVHGISDFLWCLFYCVEFLPCVTVGFYLHHLLDTFIIKFSLHKMGQIIQLWLSTIWSLVTAESNTAVLDVS